MRFAKTLIVLALSGFSALAAAGMKTNTATIVNTTYGYAFGSLSSARYSANNLEYLSCDQYSSGYIRCSARDASGVSGSCSTDATSNPGFADTMRAMNSASFVTLWWDPTTGTCTNILVRNGSNYLP